MKSTTSSKHYWQANFGEVNVHIWKRMCLWIIDKSTLVTDPSITGINIARQQIPELNIFLFLIPSQRFQSSRLGRQGRAWYFPAVVLLPPLLQLLFPLSRLPRLWGNFNFSVWTTDFLTGVSTWWDWVQSSNMTKYISFLSYHHYCFLTLR